MTMRVRLGLHGQSGSMRAWNTMIVVAEEKNRRKKKVRAEARTASKEQTKREALDGPRPIPSSNRNGAEGRWECTGHKRAAHLGATHAHLIMTLNVGGSREALINAMETYSRVLLIQEHRVAGPGLPGLLCEKAGTEYGMQERPAAMGAAAAQ